ncbi:hypothetical protein BJV78DRAFT_1153884 [Lactifluus subvellereus]|nr:hypothetical protein BJV78DRAFT_1153884 [Lactifluus subvellereus]
MRLKHNFARPFHVTVGSYNTAQYSIVHSLAEVGIEGPTRQTYPSQIWPSGNTIIIDMKLSSRKRFALPAAKDPDRPPTPLTKCPWKRHHFAFLVHCLLFSLNVPFVRNVRRACGRKGSEPQHRDLLFLNLYLSTSIVVSFAIQQRNVLVGVKAKPSKPVFDDGFKGIPVACSLVMDGIEFEEVQCLHRVLRDLSTTPSSITSTHSKLLRFAFDAHSPRQPCGERVIERQPRCISRESKNSALPLRRENGGGKWARFASTVQYGLSGARICKGRLTATPVLDAITAMQQEGSIDGNFHARAFTQERSGPPWHLLAPPVLNT